jgi:hypothetical protein
MGNSDVVLISAAPTQSTNDYFLKMRMPMKLFLFMKEAENYLPVYGEIPSNMAITL